MRKFLLLFLPAVFAISCIDNAYDLSDINTDDVTIGDEESEFRLPLATVYVSMNELNEGGIDIKALFDEAKIWLPTARAEIDLQQLLPGSAYTDTLLDELLDEMTASEAKLTQITDLIWAKYREPFLDIPALSHISDKDEALFKKTFKELFLNETALLEAIKDQVKAEVKNQAQGYLTELKVDDVKYDIGKIDIGSDVVDMLAENLDPEGTANAKNTLHIYGEITSALPISLEIDPYFASTDVRFSVRVEPGKTNTITGTQLFESDLRQIIDGTDIVMPVTLDKYFPGTDFTPDQQIVISLRLIKRGGLKLNL